MESEKHLDFLQYCLHRNVPIQESAMHINWMKMLDWADEHAIAGIICKRPLLHKVACKLSILTSCI